MPLGGQPFILGVHGRRLAPAGVRDTYRDITQKHGLSQLGNWAGVINGTFREVTALKLVRVANERVWVDWEESIVARRFD